MDKLTVKQIKNFLQKHKLKTTGNKETLFNRLTELANSYSRDVEDVIKSILEEKENEKDLLLEDIKLGESASQFSDKSRESRISQNSKISSVSSCRAAIEAKLAVLMIKDKELIKSYYREFNDLPLQDKELSIEEKIWLKFIDENCKIIGSKYEISLPLKENINDIPQTRAVALKRLKGLKKKLDNKEYCQQYTEFMEGLLTKGYAEEVQISKNDGNPIWYIPHFGVTHPAKPNKIRVVFDCAARVDNISLNDILRPGPDINNLLLGVLLRFRIGIYAYSADIETMYYQVKVPEVHRDLLRFLWWPDGNTRSVVKEYRMSSHPFGACSSPSIANFALKRTVEDNKMYFTESSCDTMLKSFYVDDCMVSLDTIEDMISNAKDIIKLCLLGGFNLTKFVSTENSFLKEISFEKLNPKMDCYMKGEHVVIKALGLSWELSSDSIGVFSGSQNEPKTKK